MRGDVHIRWRIAGRRLRARAKSVIFLFNGRRRVHRPVRSEAPLNELAANPFGEFRPGDHRVWANTISPILAQSARGTSRQSGLWISDWLPHTATMADETGGDTLVRRGRHQSLAGVCQMNTVSVLGAASLVPG